MVWPWQGGYEWHRSKENVICLVSLATVNSIPLTISCLIYMYSLISLPKRLKTHSGEKPNKCNQCKITSSWANHQMTHILADIIGHGSPHTPYYFPLICSISDLEIIPIMKTSWVMVLYNILSFLNSGWQLVKYIYQSVQNILTTLPTYVGCKQASVQRVLTIKAIHRHGF